MFFSFFSTTHQAPAHAKSVEQSESGLAACITQALDSSQFPPRSSSSLDIPESHRELMQKTACGISYLTILEAIALAPIEIHERLPRVAITEAIVQRISPLNQEFSALRQGEPFTDRFWSLIGYDAPSDTFIKSKEAFVTATRDLLDAGLLSEHQQAAMVSSSAPGLTYPIRLWSIDISTSGKSLLQSISSH